MPHTESLQAEVHCHRYFFPPHFVVASTFVDFIYSFFLLSCLSYSIVEFFKELPQFVVKAGPVLSNLYGADWENRLVVQ